FVAYFVYEIGAPVPLQTRRINWIEHTLQCRLRQRSHESERGLLECPNRLECFFCFFLWPGVCPNNSAHFFHVQIFGKRWSWRDGKKCDEAVQIIGCRRSQSAIPLQHVGCLAQLVKHRAGIERVDGM